MPEPKRRSIPKLTRRAFLSALFLSSTVQALPAGLKAEEYIGSGLTWPIAIAVLPNGDLLINEKAGAIRQVRAGALVSEPVARVEPVLKNESGLLGIALLPSFADSGEFVVTYTPARDLSSFFVSKLRLTGERAEILADPWLRLPSDPETDRHYGGNLRFADGKLYLALSDLDNPELAQDLSHPFGSILRYNEDLSIPADNPFGVDNPIYVYGLRNTFDFAIAADGGLWGAENGGSYHDELNYMRAGGNYGFPNVSGYCDGRPLLEDCGPRGKYIEPAFEFLDRIGPTGIEVYAGTLIPELEGQVLYGGWHSGRVDHFTPRGAGKVEYHGPLFVIPGGAHEQRAGDQRSHLKDYGVVDVALAHDGAIYVLTSGEEGKLYRIAPEAALVNPDKVVTEGKAVYIKSEVDPGVSCTVGAVKGGAEHTALASLLLLGFLAVRRLPRHRARRRALPFALLPFLFGAPRSAQAQELHYGGKLGLTAGRLRGNNTGVAEFAPGFAIGATGRLELLRYLSLEADLLYAQKGSGISTSDERLLLQYLSLPLLVQGTLPLGPVTPRLFAGPVGSVLLSASVRGDARTHLIETFDFGVMGGLGVDIALPIGALTVDASYERGLSLIMDRDGLPAGAPYEYNKNSTFYALAGFLY
ncbi:MAG TPA: PQQ-dependent sugar dehydrogenase [Polyangiaceae bacterium]|nr:PQQ-dependent sugar dehydrogenase [Polyangiaceae bacterium]